MTAVSFLGRLTKFVEEDSKVLVIEFLLLTTYQRCGSTLCLS